MFASQEWPNASFFSAPSGHSGRDAGIQARDGTLAAPRTFRMQGRLEQCSRPAIRCAALITNPPKTAHAIWVSARKAMFYKGSVGSGLHQVGGIMIKARCAALIIVPASGRFAPGVSQLGFAASQNPRRDAGSKKSLTETRRHKDPEFSFSVFPCLRERNS